MNTHAKQWPSGAVVSSASGRILGRAVRLQGRNGPYVKVEITSGPCAGQVEWPDGFILGAGVHTHACPQCYQPFRSDRPSDSLCPQCAGDVRPEQREYHVRDVRAMQAVPRAQWRPRTTVQRTQEEERAIAEQRARDEAESPF